MDVGLGGAAVVVSGGSKGMGRAAAESIAREGARIAVLAGRGRVEQHDCGTARPRAADVVGIPTDLTDRIQVDAAFGQLGRRWVNSTSW